MVWFVSGVAQSGVWSSCFWMKPLLFDVSIVEDRDAGASDKRRRERGTWGKGAYLVVLLLPLLKPLVFTFEALGFWF